MKALRYFLLLLLVTRAWAGNTTSTQVIDCGANKAVAFDEATSPDGHYAIGWTILPLNKKAKPVDWSLWDKEDPRKILDAYTPDPIAQEKTDDYSLVDCVIDIKGKTLLPLSSDDVDFPQKNRGFLVAAWSKPANGKRYALVENDARFSTANLWLITIDSTGLHQVDLAGSLDKAVAPLLREKRPLSFGGFETVYALDNAADESIQKPSFTDSTATISFESAIPKSDDDDTVDGRITFRLSDGAILKVSSDTKRDDPFRDVPELAKADSQLNEVYKKLLLKLDAAGRAALKKEQLDWIQTRDDDAATALRNSLADSRAHDPDADRNKSLVDSTRQRLIDLQTRLNTLH